MPSWEAIILFYSKDEGFFFRNFAFKFVFRYLETSMQILTYLVIRFMGDIREQISSGRTSWTNDTWKNEKLFCEIA